MCFGLGFGLEGVLVLFVAVPGVKNQPSQPRGETFEVI